ncbi:MAG: hypothetical protein NC548_24565 [Lachnospiraceae bacterium]|nr:hypothetical protein [Lachnospiraceae bacterium]
MENEQKMADREMPKVINRGLMVAFLLAIILGEAATVGIYEYESVYHTGSIEAGEKVYAGDFLKNENDSAYFTTDSDMVDSSVPGDYELFLRKGWFVHKCRLHITDTIPPEAEVKPVSMEMNQKCDAGAFVESIEDATVVEVSYLQEPDFSKGGKQEVNLLLTDAGGNTTEVVSELFVSQVVEELYVEAGGGMPKLSDFVIEGDNAKFKTQLRYINFNRPAEKKVEISVDGLTYQTQMYIVDTTPPTVSLHNITGYTLLPREPEDFVTSINDVTEVRVSFVKEPDVTFTGEQEVQISVVDEGENEVIKTAKLTLKEDMEPPVITGAEDLQVMIGSTVSYKKNVVVEDNCPEGLAFTVDSSAVNLSEAGAYPVVYTATDFAGNETSVSVTVTVKPRVYDPNEVNAMADAVLANILTDGMSPMDKTRAIFNYVTSHIAYISDSDKSNPTRAAYEGFHDKKGDCYVYASTSKVLLNRAGITNMDIAKIPAKTLHYWNLVDVGNGWLHFDTTPRKDHPTIFMWTDAQLMEYSANHNNSHNYDHDAYPAVN